MTLPVPPTTLVGREHELRTASELLLRNGVRLLALTVAGGTGKTRVAQQIGLELALEFADGVYFVGGWLLEASPTARSRRHS